MRDPKDYVTREEAAALLDVNVDTITRWTQQGALISETFPQTSAGRPVLYYLRSHVLDVGVAKDEKSAKVIALRALATAATAERRIMEIYEALGLNVPQLARDTSSVQALYDLSCETLRLSDLAKPGWIRYWGANFFGMEPVYFELANEVLKRDDVWLHYINLSDLIEIHARDVPREDTQLVAAYRYLEAGRQHLMVQGFIHCVQKYGLPFAVQNARRGQYLVSEICAAIH